MLDVFTILVALIAFHIALALGVSVVLRRGRDPDTWPGLGDWLRGMYLIIAGWSVRIFGFGLPTEAYVPIGLGLVSAGFGMYYRATCHFFGRRPSNTLAFLPPVLVAAQQALWMDDFAVRAVFVNTVLALQCMFVMVAAIIYGDRSSGPARWLFVAALAVGAGSIGIRALLVLLRPEGINDLMTPHPVNAVSLLVSICAGLVLQAAMLGLQMRRSEQQIERLANTDALTGAMNRRAFATACGVELARMGRQAAPTSMLVIDVDHFKRINDRFGHAAGDNVLTAIARSVRARIRTSDVLARVGGEEFQVLLPGTNAVGAEQLAEAILGTVSGLVFEKPDLQVTVSIGVAQFDSADSNLAGTARRADAALYEAKAAGRNTVRVSSLNSLGPPNVTGHRPTHPAAGPSTLCPSDPRLPGARP